MSTTESDSSPVLQSQALRSSLSPPCSSLVPVVSMLEHSRSSITPNQYTPLGEGLPHAKSSSPSPAPSNRSLPLSPLHHQGNKFGHKSPSRQSHHSCHSSVSVPGSHPYTSTFHKVRCDWILTVNYSSSVPGCTVPLQDLSHQSPPQAPAVSQTFRSPLPVSSYKESLDCYQNLWISCGASSSQAVFAGPRLYFGVSWPGRCWCSGLHGWEWYSSHWHGGGDFGWGTCPVIVYPCDHCFLLPLYLSLALLQFILVGHLFTQSET